MMLLTQTPEIRMTEVFTRMPEKFRRKGELTSWARANRLGVSGDSFLEGPVFDEAGNLFVTDIECGRIFRIDPQGNWELVVEYDGEPTGRRSTIPLPNVMSSTCPAASTLREIK
jgi:gluconolactonase